MCYFVFQLNSNTFNFLNISIQYSVTFVDHPTWATANLSTLLLIEMNFAWPAASMLWVAEWQTASAPLPSPTTKKYFPKHSTHQMGQRNDQWPPTHHRKELKSFVLFQLATKPWNEVLFLNLEHGHKYLRRNPSEETVPPEQTRLPPSIFSLVG